MATPAIGSSGNGAPITFSGLASGLDTSSIIQALLAVERQPIAHLTSQQEKLAGQQQQLQTIRASLRELSFAASEFIFSAAFENSQNVTSSEPLRVSAASSAGAGVGGYEVEVKQLANSAQRTFTFTPPGEEDTVTIDGHEYTIKSGATAKELASKINSDGKATVFAAVVNSETIVFSNRATGVSEGEFITVSDSAGALEEKAGTAKEGRNAEFSVDGVASTATSNVITTAIAGVTLTLSGTTSSGPVTINVQAPGPSVSAIEAQVQSFVTLYNKTVEAVQKELTTKAPSNPQNAAEFATGTLFGDHTLSSLLSSMRRSMYEPIKGLPEEMASPLNIGLTTGAAASSGNTSQSAVSGLLKLNLTKLQNAVKENPEAVQEMLKAWGKGLEVTINGIAETGGALDTRINSDGTQITQLRRRISVMNEMLAVRQKALQQTYAQLETVISRNSSQTSWLVSQSEALARSGL